MDDGIEVIGKYAFSMCPRLARLEFGVGAKLRRIESHAFSSLPAIHSMSIPSFVDSIHGAAFALSGIRDMQIADGNRYFRVVGDFLVDSAGTSLIRYFGAGMNVTVLSAIRVISAGAFSSAIIKTVRFEGDSELRRIDSRAFFQCAYLRALWLPSQVESIDGSAFGGCDLRMVQMHAWNRHFCVSGEFLMSWDERCLVRHLGHASVLRIRRDIEVLGVGSFASCDWLRRVAVESSSQLRCVCDRAFDGCTHLYSISLPASTECLGHLCFRKCDHLREFRVEYGSKLRRIESDSFSGGCSLRSIWVPKSLRGQSGVDLGGAAHLDIEWYMY
jgi:hypothetical protein